MSWAKTPFSHWRVTCQNRPSAIGRGSLAQPVYAMPRLYDAIAGSSAVEAAGYVQPDGISKREALYDLDIETI